MMNDYLFEVKNINKIYSKHHVLKDISFAIEPGKICGLIGENGAGKTTLIRILSGLIKENSGSINGLSKMNISSIVEGPALHLNLTAYENLKYQSLLCGNKDFKNKIQEILKLVGLSNVDKKKKVKDYSMGMKQRLAIGIAIIDSPKLLILDEPINGLDPRGIKDVRDVLNTLKKDYSMTILISSHILSELDLVADDYIIMNKGTIIKVVSNEEVKSSLEKKIIISSPCNEKVLIALNNQGIACRTKGPEIELGESDLTITNIIDILRQHNIAINEIFKKQVSFEEYYLNLIEGRRVNDELF